MRRKPEDRIGERFLSKRPPPARHGPLILAAIVAALAGVVILFVAGEWEAGVVGVFALSALTLWARRTMLP